MLEAIAGYDENDPYTWNVPVPDYRSQLTGDIRGMKIGVVKELMDVDSSGVTPVVRDAILTAIEVLSELGANVEEVSIPYANISGVVSRTITSVERVSLHPEWIRERPQDFHPNIRVGFMTGELVPAQVYYKAQKARDLIRQQVLDAFTKYDVLVQPVSSSPPGILDLTPGLRERGQADTALREANFRSLYSLTGNPALSVCCGFTNDEKPLPLAVQIAAKPFNEAAALKVAHAYEQATDWHKRRPPV
jgi:aspartyl-tRNA(Asn)/glutamyl-tRNA(Gln) amidotransferase subunit A